MTLKNDFCPKTVQKQYSQAGPKISHNVNYTQRDDGGAKGPERSMEARSAEGWGLGSPSPVWGSGGIAPRNFLNLTVQICSFFPRFQDRDSSPIFCFSFIYCLYLFLSSPSEFDLRCILLLQVTLQQSQLHTIQSQLHTLCQKTHNFKPCSQDV